jgi:UDP-N-acetylmuramate--alanine ligase
VVTNIDAEHLDHWSGGLDEIVDAFVDFINKVPFYGCAILCLDHPTVQASLPRIEKRYMTYGISSQADYSAHDVEANEGSMSFTVRRHGEELGRIELNMVGRHNVENALAAIAVADEVGMSFEVIAEALNQFEGIGRRFEVKGCVNDVMVVDDYGHHPAEIRATLEAAREAYSRRLVIAFQPHRYTRTRDFMNEFATAFNASDVVLVSDIYAASEEPIEGITAEALTENITLYGHGDATCSGDLEGTLGRLLKVVQPGDLVITLGAGSIYRVGERLLERLGEG